MGMKSVLTLLVVSLGWSAPCFAQDFSIDEHLIDRCFPLHDDPMRCVGRQAYECILRNGGGPNMVLGACYQAEAEVWDRFLNNAYRETMALAKAREEMDLGYDAGALTDALRDMQRAWIEFRDARCGNVIAIAKPFGSQVSAVSSQCKMEETARQYFVLRGLRQDYVN